MISMARELVFFFYQSVFDGNRKLSHHHSLHGYVGGIIKTINIDGYAL